jgi:hypothetical protein
MYGINSPAVKIKRRRPSWRQIFRGSWMISEKRFVLDRRYF